MHEGGKSDGSVVPEKSPNKGCGEPRSAEGMEGRDPAKGNPSQPIRHRTQSRARLQQALARVRRAVQKDRGLRLSALWHHVEDLDRLREAYFSLEHKSAPGVDGETWQHYGEDLESHLQDLSERLKRGAYRARPVRRAFVPKDDGRERPIGVPVLEDGKRTVAREGTPQGGSISPLLANIYLHFVFDVWADAWRNKRASGDVIIVRFADDFIVGFQHREDAERFRAELTDRFRRFNLELHPDKTRLIRFGRFAAGDRQRRGEGKPETFDFLGFTHICGETRSGAFQVVRRTMRKRLRTKLRAVKVELHRRMHDPITEVGAWLRSVVDGHANYYGVHGNGAALKAFRNQSLVLWHRALSRRSQTGYVSWKRMYGLAKRWLPSLRVRHPWPEERLCVKT